MNRTFVSILFCLFLSLSVALAQNTPRTAGGGRVSFASQDTVLKLINLLDSLALNSDNPFFKQHCISILDVIQAKELSAYRTPFVKKMFSAFSDTAISSNAGRLSSYKERKRPFIVSWTSPEDSVVSLAWLLLPENWNPELQYPLYVTLHGLYSPYSDPVEYMAGYLTPERVVEKSFEDGYSLFPWGRGNLWYEGIAETDVWESIAAAESFVKVNPARKYLVGHSMGGYGAWAIGQKSAETWAALGIHAGALWYDGSKYLTAAVAQKLKEVPVFFVCGTQDGLLGVNQTAYQLLQDAGNTDLAFETFPGGHEALLENWDKMYKWVRNFTKDGTGTAVENKKQVPDRVALFPNYPNPFNPETAIKYQLSTLSPVKIALFDLLGREVASIVDQEQDAGTYEVKFNGSNLSSGMYLYRITAGGFVQTRKMILSK